MKFSSALRETLYIKLRRKTNSLDFIPQIDGLRFIAIFLVVFAHLIVFIMIKTDSLSHITFFQKSLYEMITTFGHKGVLLFFVISGFILGLPFAKRYKDHTERKTFMLKEYFLRRCTRIEPPYFFNTIIFSLLFIFFSKGYTLALPDYSILYHTLASLFYIHNIIYPTYLAINSVTWSLEIEVQFYLLAPLLALLFKVKYSERILILCIILFTFLQHILVFPFLSLFNFIHFFLVGFLLAEMYVAKNKLLLPVLDNVLIAIPLFLYFIFVSIEKTHNGFYSELQVCLLLFSLSYIALFGKLFTKIISNPFLTTIGGMCYTIYLWHMTVISGIGNHTIKIFEVSHLYSYILIQILLITPLVLLVSIPLYLFIEKPCMDKNWPKKVYYFIQKMKR